MHPKLKRIHMVGIGGIGMCGIAEVLHNLGYTVTGSDLHDSATVQRLQDLGLPRGEHDAGDPPSGQLPGDARPSDRRNRCPFGIRRTESLPEDIREQPEPFRGGIFQSLGD